MDGPTYTIINLISGILTILSYAIITRAVVSWIRPNPQHPLMRLLKKVTDPILNPLERIIPPIAGMDFSPVIAIILIQLVQGVLPSLLGGL